MDILTSSPTSHKAGWNDTDEDLMKMIQHRENSLIQMLIPNTVFLGLLLLLGTTGNMIVFVIYTTKIKDKNGQENQMFIKCLALSDLTASILGTTLGIGMNFHPLSFNNNTVCSMLWFLTVIPVFLSGFILVIISIQRFLCVCHPHGYQINLFWTKMSVGCCFAGSVVVALPSVFLIRTVEIIHNGRLIGHRCGKRSEAEFVHYHFIYDVFIMVIGSLGVMIMTVLYVLIGRAILRQMKFRQKFKIRSVEDKYRFESQDCLNVSDDTPPSPVYRDKSSIEVNTNIENHRNTTTTIQNAERSKYSSRNHNENDEANRNRAKYILMLCEKFRFSIMFSLISVIFAISYFPRMYIMSREVIDPMFWENLQSDEEIIFHLFLYRMYIINNVSNIFVYLTFDKRFRQHIHLSCNNRQSWQL